MIAIFKEIYRYRELLWTLAMRDIKARYKQTLLGIGWALFFPLITMLVFSLVFSKFIKVDTGGIPYPIFAYCGILPWTFFASGLNFSINSLITNAGLLSKIYFPREVLPLSAILANLVDFCIASVILFVMMLFYGFSLHLTILLVPLVLLIQIIFTAGVGFIFSMANLFFRDIKYVFQVIIPLWMFVTPVLYQIPEKFRWLYRINPMAPIIPSYRLLILEGSLPSPSGLVSSALVSLGIFIIGILWFRKMAYLFAENI